jgi:parallel beta-helix repeat protein
VKSVDLFKPVTKKSVWVSLFVFALLVSSFTVGYDVHAVSLSYSTVIENGSMAEPWSYIFFKDGSTYYARNGLTGAIDYYGTTAATVIQNAFNQHGSSYFFKAGIYNLNGNTVTANVPVIIEGEGTNSVILGGTLKVQGEDCNYASWIYNQNIVRNLRFNSTGTVTNLWYVNVTQGIIEKCSFWKTSFALGIPQVRLTNCLSIYVQDNWFDGYNCQILKIDGTYAWLPFHYILRNAFGSTLLGTFPTQNGPWEVAAVYIEGSNNVYTLIQNNVAFLNPKEIFVFSQSAATMIYSNEIECGEGNYAIWLKSESNKVENNIINLDPSSQGAICIYYNATTPLYYNSVKNNHIDSSDSTYAIFVGASYYSEISGNTIFGKNGIYLYNCGYNQITNNVYRKIGATSNFALQEAGASDYNVITNMYARNGYIYKVGANTKVNLCWNYTTWIP